MNKNILIIFLVILITLSSVYAVSIDSAIEDQLEENDEVSVIVMLKDKETRTKSINSLENKKIDIKRK